MKRYSSMLSSNVAVYFYLRHESETKSMSSSRSARNAFDVLMLSAIERVLPEAPPTRSNNSQIALDCLLGDLIEYLRTEGLRFPPSIQQKKQKKTTHLFLLHVTLIPQFHK
jgi:hypothetical protein